MLWAFSSNLSAIEKKINNVKKRNYWQWLFYLLTFGRRTREIYKTFIGKSYFSLDIYINITHRSRGIYIWITQTNLPVVRRLLFCFICCLNAWNIHKIVHKRKMTDQTLSSKFQSWVHITCFNIYSQTHQLMDEWNDRSKFKLTKGFAPFFHQITFFSSFVYSWVFFFLHTYNYMHTYIHINFSATIFYRKHSTPTKSISISFVFYSRFLNLFLPLLLSMVFTSWFDYTRAT